MLSNRPHRHASSFGVAPCRILCLALGSLLPAAPLRAVDYYWDANGAAAGTGGTGTWGAANTWRDGSAAGTLGSWVDGNAAVFGGTAGLTTAAAPVSPAELRFAISNHNLIGAGPVDFGAGGAINFTGSISGVEITTPLSGAVTINPANPSNVVALTFKTDSAGLTAVTLTGNDPNRHILVDHAGSLGPAGIPVSINSVILGLGALTSESIGLASNAANGSGGGMSFPAWNLTLGANASIRGRAGANTLNSPTTLTGNAALLARAAAGVKLTLSATATVDLGANTLSLHPGTGSDGIVLNGAITGAGGLTQAASTLALGGGASGAGGTSTLAGANTYTGPTAINSGHLRLTGSLTSDVTLASGSNLGGEGSTTGSLTFIGTHSLSFDPSTPAALTAASVNAAAATITLTPSVLAAGTGIVILDAPGGITGAVGTNFLFSGRGTAYLNGDSTKLLFDFTPLNLVWKGGDAGNPNGWDTNTTANWLNGAAAEKFLAGDHVRFDDTATTTTVTIQGADAQPASVVIDTAATYTIGGAPIAGLGALTKLGNGTAILAGNNSYSGGTTISAGTLQFGDGSGAAASLGSGPVVNNAALVLNPGAGNVTLAGDVTGTGTFTHAGTGTAIVTGSIANAGGTTINAGATLQIGNSGLTGGVSGSIVNNGVLVLQRSDATTLSNAISGSGEVRKAAGAIATLTGANAFSGQVNISGNGISLVAGSAAALGDATGGTSVGAGARLVLADGVTIPGEAVTIAGGAQNFNGALQAAAGATATWGGPIILNSADARIGAEAGGTLIVTGPVQNSTGNALFIGAGVGGVGTVVLASPLSSSTFTGNTNIIRGTVKLGAAETLPPGTIVDVDFSTAAEACVFDLNGFSQSVSGLQRSGTATGGSATVTNSSATAATLTLNQAITTTYSGAVTGNLALVKDGPGQLDLTGAISHTGSTRIKAGTLGFTQTGLSDAAAFTIDAGAVAALNFTGNDRVGSLVINGATLPNGVYSSTSHGGIYAASITGPGALQVGPLGYDAWIAGFPTLTGDAALTTADPDTDGVANLLEFVLGGTPTVSDAGILPALSATPDGLSVVLTFKRSDPSQLDTTLVLQVGTDLAIWPPASEITIGATGDASGTLPGGVTYTVQENADLADDIVLTLPKGAAPRTYLRLKATKP